MGGFPVTVTKGGKEEQCLHAIDLQGWKKAGWKVKDETQQSEAKQPEAKKTGGDGLDGLSKESLMKIAKSKDIEVDARWGEDRLIKEIRG